MGIDFIRSKRQSRRKAWNHQVVRGAQDLLTTLPPHTRQTIRASIDGILPEVGHTLTLQLTTANEVVVREQNEIVGKVKRPDATLIAGLYQHSGMAAVTVAAKLDKSKTVDLTLDE